MLAGTWGTQSVLFFQIGCYHITCIKPVEIFDHIVSPVSALTFTWLGDKWTGELPLWWGQNRMQHCTGSALSSQADIWKTLWWSATSCSTSSENYPISLTHYSHNLKSLLVAKNSVPILLPSATITQNLLLNELKWVMLSRPLTEAVCFGCLSPLLVLVSRTYWKQAMKQPHSTVTQSCELMCCGDCGSSLFAVFFTDVRVGEGNVGSAASFERVTLVIIQKGRPVYLCCGRSILDKVSDFMREDPTNLMRILPVKLQLIVKLASCRAASSRWPCEATFQACLSHGFHVSPLSRCGTMSWRGVQSTGLIPAAGNTVPVTCWLK